MSEYTKAVDTYLAEIGVTMAFRLIGDDCPTFCEDRGKYTNEIGVYPRKHHIHGRHYIVSFFREGGKKQFSTDFWNSYQDEETNAFFWEKNRLERLVPIENVYWDKFGKYPRRPNQFRKVPTAYDVLACVEKNEVGTFEDFCGNFGYDTDSRKAETVYRAVCEEYRKVQNFFTAEELDKLNEIAV